eukprot:gene9567-10556_t
MALMEEKKDMEGRPKTNPKVLGLGLMAAAGCFLTIGNVVVQYTHKKWPANVSTFEVLFIRSLIQLVFIVGFMVYGKVSVYGNSLRNLIVLIVMGIAEVAAIIFVYLALERIPVGDATVIQFTAPVFTTAFSFLFLRKGCGVLDTVCGVLSFGGVIVMARPTMLFSHKQHQSSGVSHNFHVVKNTGYQPGNHKYLEGIGFAILAAVCLSLFFILNKMTGKRLDVTLTIFYPSLVGVIVSPIFIGAWNKAWFAWDGEIWGFIIMVGFISFVGMMFMAESLQLEDAGPAILVRNLDVVYAFVMQFLLLGLKPDLLTLVGAGIILASTSLVAINRTIFARIEMCQRLQNKALKEPDESRFPLLLTDEQTTKKRFHSKDTL